METTSDPFYHAVYDSDDDNSEWLRAVAGEAASIGHYERATAYALISIAKSMETMADDLHVLRKYADYDHPE